MTADTTRQACARIQTTRSLDSQTCVCMCRWPRCWRLCYVTKTSWKTRAPPCWRSSSVSVTPLSPCRLCHVCVCVFVRCSSCVRVLPVIWLVQCAEGPGVGSQAVVTRLLRPLVGSLTHCAPVVARMRAAAGFLGSPPPPPPLLPALLATGAALMCCCLAFCHVVLCGCVLPVGCGAVTGHALPRSRVWFGGTFSGPLFPLRCTLSMCSGSRHRCSAAPACGSVWGPHHCGPH